MVVYVPAFPNRFKSSKLALTNMYLAKLFGYSGYLPLDPLLSS